MWCDVLVWASALQPHTHTLTHSHTFTIPCTCCYDEIKGAQDQDLFSCWFSDSLSIWFSLSIYQDLKIYSHADSLILSQILWFSLWQTLFTLIRILSSSLYIILAVMMTSKNLKTSRFVLMLILWFSLCHLDSHAHSLILSLHLTDYLWKSNLVSSSCSRCLCLARSTATSLSCQCVCVLTTTRQSCNWLPLSFGLSFFVPDYCTAFRRNFGWFRCLDWFAGDSCWFKCAINILAD